MKTQLDKQALTNELAFQKESKRDFLIDTSRLTVAEDFFDGGDYYLTFKDMSGDEHSYVITPYMMGQIGQLTRVSLGLIDAMSKGTPRERNELGQLLSVRLQENNAKRLIRTMGRHAGDPIARAVLSPRYRIIDNWDLFSTIDETYGGQIASAAITDTRLYLKFVFPVLEASMGTIKKKGKEIGDIVNAGAMLVNSEVGYGTLRFNGYLYRLSCKNGAVITETTGEGIKQIHLGPANTEDNWDEYVVTDESAAENFRLFTQIRDALEHTTLNKIDFEELALQFMMTKESAVVVDRGTVLTNTQRMFGISVEESRKIERIWAKDEENSGNKFGFINAITNAARDTAGTMSYDRATELETLGGSLITLEEDVWVKLNETTNVVQISSKRKSRKK